MMVPTPVYGTPVGVGRPWEASIVKTSSSGRENRTALFQFRWSSSSQARVVGLNLTMRPTCGCGSPAQLVVGGGRPPGMGSPPTMHGAALLHTSPSLSVVVWLPEWKTAAYTVLPSGLTASARGVSP